MSERSRSRSPVRSDVGKPKFLFIGNLPKRWRNHANIRNFLMDKASVIPNVNEKIMHVYILKDDDGPKGEVQVYFTEEKFCRLAYTALQGVEYEGKKLEVRIDSELLKLPRSKTRNKKYQGERTPLRDRVFRTANMEQNFKGAKHETFGLEAGFLDRLGITPPLVNKIYITNLSPEVTETKLREVFGYAGIVVSAALINKNPAQPLGKILYEHPVEAVQAISMFHNQPLFNMKMSVQMDRRALGAIPFGLGGVGMGLGPNGEPLRGIRTMLEIQPLKQLILKELSKIPDLTENRQNQSMDSNQQNLMSMLSVNTNMNQNNPFGALMQLLQEKMSENLASLNWNSMQQGNEQNPFNQNAFGNNQSQQTPPTSRFDIPPIGLTQAPLGNLNAFANIGQNPLANLQNAMVNVGPTLANLNANVGTTQQAPRSRFDIPPSGMNIQNTAAVAANSSNQSQIWGSGQSDWGNTQGQSKNNFDNNSKNSGYGSSQYNPDEFDVQRLSDLNKPDAKNTMTSSDMLLFQNLPASVTSKALINKMREVGELKFAEITGQGRAVVRFQDAGDAERCVKLYDRSKVDGQVITVKLF